MATPVILKIILTDGSSQRLTLRNGFPASIDDLMVEVKKQCGLEGNYRLQFMDPMFGNEFLNLTSVSELVDKGTLKATSVCSPVTEPLACSLSSVSDSNQSNGTVDTDILSPSESTSSRLFWPVVFHVPKFSYDAEFKLQEANLAYIQNGNVLVPDPKLKSAILEGLIQEIVQYKVYVCDKEIEQVAQSLVKKHPCLTEKGSCTGFGGWKVSLKYKLSNYRTQLRKLGCPEVVVNSLKYKPPGKCSSAYGVKKAKRAEVNFCPAYPSSETKESLEAMQKDLLLDVKKRDNRQVVKLKMEKTFALRRQEVVREAPMVEHFMARWPALFEVSEINAEFKRITTVPLQSKFLSQLDLHSDNLFKLFRQKGGQLARRLQTTIDQMAECDDIDAGREYVIKGLCIYMGEDPKSLVQEYVGMDEVSINGAIQGTTVGVYVLKQHAACDESEDVGIILEGIKVLQYLDNVPLAVAMLFGLMYSLNLSYPVDLRYTFEVIQKIFMELDGDKLSNKVLHLKNRLFQ